MSAFRERYGPFALVAGASEGLGAEFARQLGERGLDLILVARRVAPLEALGDEIRRRHGVAVITASLDLGAPALLAEITALTDGREVGLLVYNAARSTIGEFLDQPLTDHLHTLDVNCRGPVILAHHFGRRMVERGRGGVVLMSSLAGSQGTPMVACYGATKAFTLVFGEGLWEELGRRGVDVVACRAGATRTETFERTQPRHAPLLMEPAPVVRETLALLGRRSSLVPGWANAMTAFALNRLLPRAAAVRILGRATRSMYQR